jgi:hypothetical protein
LHNVGFIDDDTRRCALPAGRVPARRLDANQGAQSEKHSYRGLGFLPLGVLNARDILQVLLQESEDKEAMLRDYVMGIGY